MKCDYVTAALNSTLRWLLYSRKYQYGGAKGAWRAFYVYTGCDIDGLVQDCSNARALALELLQSCTNHRYIWRSADCYDIKWLDTPMIKLAK